MKLEKPRRAPFTTPVLIIAFNRPQYVKMQLEQLRLVQPKTIYIACDGPREHYPDDLEKVEQVKVSYLEGIDWECDIHTSFSTENLGCSKGPIQAISWFFSRVEFGIILEDDIIPSQDFFGFMAQMLDFYRSQHKVISISGCNFGYQSPSNHVVVSKIMNMWGWGTWANRWHAIDFELKDWPSKARKRWYLHQRLKTGVLDYDAGWIRHWQQIFDKTVTAHKVTWWDYQFIYHQLKWKRVTLFPPVNLVKNIGFDADATHTFEKAHFSKYLSWQELHWPLQMPTAFKVDCVFYEHYIKGIWSFYKRPNWNYFLGQWLKRLGLKR